MLLTYWQHIRISYNFYLFADEVCNTGECLIFEGCQNEHIIVSCYSGNANFAAVKLNNLQNREDIILKVICEELTVSCVLKIVR